MGSEAGNSLALNKYKPKEGDSLLSPSHPRLLGDRRPANNYGENTKRLDRVRREERVYFYKIEKQAKEEKKKDGGEL